MSTIVVREYGSVSTLRQAVQSGIVLPPDFDASVKQGEEIALTIFTWGESSSRSRTILKVTLINLIREIVGQKPPLEVKSVTLGEGV